jgi:hypothetical protein
MKEKIEILLASKREDQLELTHKKQGKESLRHCPFNIKKARPNSYEKTRTAGQIIYHSSERECKTKIYTITSSTIMDS